MGGCTHTHIIYSSPGELVSPAQVRYSVNTLKGPRFGSAQVFLILPGYKLQL